MLRALTLFLILTFTGLSAMAEDFSTTLRQAENGDSAAMHSIGVIYANGEGRPQDYNEAFKWFEKAAMLGQHNAMYSLGIMYERGQGREADLVKSAAWYTLAALYIPRLVDEWFLPRAKVEMYIRQPTTIFKKLTDAQSLAAAQLRTELGAKIALPQPVASNGFMVLSRAWIKPEWGDGYTHGLVREVDPRLLAVKYEFATPMGTDINSAEAFYAWQECMFGAVAKQRGFSHWALGGTKNAMSQALTGKNTLETVVVLLNKNEEPEAQSSIKNLSWATVRDHTSMSALCKTLLRPELMWK